jgi:dihydrofolate reductase
MSELIADLFISVDGCAKGSRSPAYFGFGGPDLDRWIGDQMKRPQRHLMGRKTYQALAALPEPAHDEGSLSLAATPTTVFSRTLGAVSWPRATISDDLTGTVGRLKAGETGQEPAFARLPDIGLDLVGQSVLDGRIVLSEYRPSGVPPYAS